MALLSRDTSGVYALDILKLEQEIADKRRDIADTSTDDYINNLREQYETEAELRQNEIDAMQEALDQKLEDMTEYWAEVDAIMETGYAGIMSFLMEYDKEFNQGSASMRQSWLEDWDLAINQALAYLDALADGFGSLTGSVLNDIFKMSSALSDLTSQMEDTGSVDDRDPGGPPPKYAYKEYYADLVNGQAKVRYRTAYASTKTQATALSEQSQEDAQEEAKNYNRTGYWDASERKKGYDKGGLVDFTGPAIVHGSTSKPEAFLDYEDTRNVAGLRDELRKMNLGSAPSFSKDEDANRPVYVDMDIFVEQLSSELDIHDLTDAVRDDILRASHYRNNVEVTIKR